MENSGLGDNAQSIDAEEARLLEEYEELTIKLQKQQMILSVMKNIDCNSIKDVDDSAKKNIDHALDFVRAFDYLKLDNSGTNVLGIPDKPHELSYIEKRALKAKVLEELAKQYGPELEYCRKLPPEVIEPEILDKELLEVKTKQKELTNELARKKLELCKELVECVEIRLGPNQENDMKLTKAKSGVEQVKAQLIQALIEENINGMSDHVAMAMQKIETCLDNAIGEKHATA